MDGRVAYVCVRVEHQTARPQDSLTMHEDLWAYCPSGSATPHEWRAVSDVDLAELKFRLAHS
ncbi:MAG: hypothetical protein E6I28_03815 [Chloroflexi bacterium]|nr:MAG: hypothetical protein E6I28_03815 [Chloroflexota bacterium]